MNEYSARRLPNYQYSEEQNKVIDEFVNDIAKKAIDKSMSYDLLYESLRRIEQKLLKIALNEPLNVHTMSSNLLSKLTIGLEVLVFITR